MTDHAQTMLIIITNNIDTDNNSLSAIEAITIDDIPLLLLLLVIQLRVTLVPTKYTYFNFHYFSSFCYRRHYHSHYVPESLFPFVHPTVTTVHT